MNNEEKKIEEHVVVNSEFTRPSAFKIPGKNGRGARCHIKYYDYFKINNYVGI